MTDRSLPHVRSTNGGLHVQISKLLIAAVIVATAATGALIVAILFEMPERGHPPPGPNGMPPPPPDLQPLVVFSIVTGLFVLSWLAVLVVFSRDQILLQLRQQQQPGVSTDELTTKLSELRAELAAEREQELRNLSESLTEMTIEYGERRETDGYLNGMRTATLPDQPENVRSLRRSPPQK
ncbi:hypothetical protein HH310_06830 [Actinoplanes sp. TBRC 11911]|uniref:hypothetical protein n=1 Tax=Actinoplanes sp. TBRC 11911 TaxID=2729386 RepID=UPI00145CFC68|nr:hypothetical protein [Actinoplanes sp. TBRC 11911]NMO50906.1 hypothetical protein [Actinoplanes sp. TBRC 11911]